MQILCMLLSVKIHQNIGQPDIQERFRLNGISETLIVVDVDKSLCGGEREALILSCL